MNNPYTPEFTDYFIHDVNREKIEQILREKRNQIKAQTAFSVVTPRFKNTWLNNWKEKAKNGIQ